MYAGLAIFLTNRIVDAILYGINYAKVVYIISDQSQVILEMVTRDLEIGVTTLQGEGGYSGRAKTVLFCAIKQKQQITKLKRIVYSQDPDAFLIIYDAREVFGLGFGKAD